MKVLPYIDFERLVCFSLNFYERFLHGIVKHRQNGIVKMITRVRNIVPKFIIIKLEP